MPFCLNRKQSALRLVKVASASLRPDLFERIAVQWFPFFIVPGRLMGIATDFIFMVTTQISDLWQG